MFHLELSARFQKDFEKFNERWRGRIIRRLEVLKIDPFCGKKLHGDLSNIYAIRLWTYRILYSIEKKKLIVLVLSIGHRKDIYR